jgi:hypothetical protein
MGPAPFNEGVGAECCPGRPSREVKHYTGVDRRTRGLRQSFLIDQSLHREFGIPHHVPPPRDGRLERRTTKHRCLAESPTSVDHFGLVEDLIEARCGGDTGESLWAIRHDRAGHRGQHCPGRRVAELHD